MLGIDRNADEGMAKARNQHDRGISTGWEQEPRPAAGKPIGTPAPKRAEIQRLLERASRRRRQNAR